MARQRSNPLYQKLKATIIEQIRRGDYKPGDQLPNQKQLSETYEVALGTVSKAIQELVHEGILESKTRTGVHVRQHSPQSPSGTIAYLVRGLTPSPDNPNYNLFLQIQQHLSGWDSEMSLIPAIQTDADGLNEFIPIQKLCGRDFVGLIVMNVMDIEFLARLKTVGAPVIVLDRNTVEIGLDCVTFDNLGTSFRLTRELIRQGHKKIGFLGEALPMDRRSQIDYDTATYERYLGYKLALESEGLKVDESRVVFRRAMAKESMDDAAKRLLQINPDMTAIARGNLGTDTKVGLWKILSECGRDIALAGWQSWSIREGDYLTKSAVYADFDISLMAQHAAEMLKSRLTNRQADITHTQLSGQIYKPDGTLIPA